MNLMCRTFGLRKHLSMITGLIVTPPCDDLFKALKIYLIKFM